MDSLTETFCLIDDFCRQFEPAWHKRMLQAGSKKRRRKSELGLSELMTLAILFHQLRFRQFKSFYLNHACRYLRAEFPKLPSYQRVVEPMPRCAVGRLVRAPEGGTATASPSPTPRRWRSATTSASPATRSSRARRSAARPPWAGS